MKTDMEHYRRQFYQEMRDILESVNKDLLQAEADPENKELLNSIFRGIHTIKGCAGTLDLNEVSDFTHHLEGMLVALREGKILLEPVIVDVVLEGADELGAMVGRLERGESVTVNADLVERFRSSYRVAEKEKVCKAGTSPGIPAGNEAVSAELAEAPEEIRPRLQKYAAEGLHIFKVEVNYPSEVFENGFDPIVLLRNLKEASAFYHAEKRRGQFPIFDDYEPLKLYLNPVVYAATRLSQEEVIDLCFDRELVRVSAIDCGKMREASIACMPDKADVQEFLAGAGEMIDSLESAVMDYEKTDAVESLNKIFRIIHTIKGDVAYIGLTELTEFTHALESVLERLRKGSMKRTPAVVDMLLKSLDSLKINLDRLRQGKNVMIIPQLYDQLENCRHGKEEETDGVLALPMNGMQKVLFEQISQYRNILLTSLANMPPDGERTQIIRRSLNSLSWAMSSLGIKTINSLLFKANDFIAKKDHDQLTEALEDLVAFIDGLMGRSKKIGEILVDGGKLTEEELDRTLDRQKPIGKLLVEDGKVSETDLARALKRQELMNAAQQLKSEGTAEPEVKTLRIDERKVVQFSDIVGELMVARNTYEYLINQLSGANGNLLSIVKSLRDNLHLFSRLSNDMHHGVMSLRMIPIRGIFQKFSRVIRDISRKQSKDIRYLTEGEEIEIDKKVADILSDPLIHIIRNSCDHGIETPEDRRRSGKPDQGTLILRAAQEGSSLIITIIDDGRGIDREKLREKACALGIGNVKGDEDSLLDLVFMPGLSTKNVASDISGRGVGMDVVKTTMKSLGGTVKVASELGKGTEIVLSIPMTMGINVVLLVESGMNHYALPIDSVVETIKIDAGLLHTNRGNRFFYYRGEVIPADRLETILKSKGNGNAAEKALAPVRTNHELPVVIIKSRSGKRGIIVDRLHRNMEMAVKPIPGSLAGIDVISGVSIMGDGKVLLMLNPERLV
jgi:two-component system chemotaxis sensor kinase CheA